MGGSGRRRRVSAGCLLAAGVAATLVLALPAPLRADPFDKAVAEIDAALATNPKGVPPESLRSCQAMRETAILLRKMGHYDRAIRRLRSCRKLLRLDEDRSLRPLEPGHSCAA